MEAVIRFMLRILSDAIYDYLFVEELGWEGILGWDIGPVKAPAIQVILVHSLPTFTSPPLPPVYHGLGTCTWLPAWLPKKLVAWPSLAQLACHMPRQALRCGHQQLGS